MTITTIILIAFVYAVISGLTFALFLHLDVGVDRYDYMGDLFGWAVALACIWPLSLPFVFAWKLVANILEDLE